ncbi:MAG: glycosyltransferase family 2 protein [Planctomycetota bacterium]
MTQMTAPDSADSIPGPAPCISLSVIIPVFNEQDSLHQLIEELQTNVQNFVLTFEIFLIDDGSTDRSWETIQLLSLRNPNVSGIRLRRNFGKAAALTAGMKAARGELMLMLDADLQDDPAEFPALLRQIDAGFDVVNGWKQRRLDPWHKVYPSRIFNWLVSRLSGLHLHDHNCGLKLFRTELSREVQIYGELHRFIPVLAYARGFKVTEVPVHHRARQFGHSKYGVRRFLRGLLDLLTVTFLTSFGRRPQHALGTIGFSFFLLGIAGLSYLSLLWFAMQIGLMGEPRPIGNRPLLAYSIAATLLGGQALSLGLLAELIVANTIRSADSYSVKELTKKT